MTLSGKAMTYKYFSRQTFLDDAVIGQVPQGAATGQVRVVTLKSPSE